MDERFINSVEENNVEEVKQLFDESYNVDLLNYREEEDDSLKYDSYNILSVIAQRGYTEILKVVLTHINPEHIDFYDDDNAHALYYAVNDLAMLTLLLENNADANQQESHGETALHAAVQGKKVDSVDLLLSLDEIDISLLDKKNKTALEYATDENIEIKKLFRNKERHDQKLKLLEELHKLKIAEIDEDIAEQEFNLNKVITKTISLKEDIEETELKLNQLKEEASVGESEMCKIENQLKRLEIKKKKVMTTEPQFYDDKFDDGESLECPVCLIIPIAPKQVLQCTNGHVFCNMCAEDPSLDVCPQCRVTLNRNQPIRNLFFEALIAKNHKKGYL